MLYEFKSRTLVMLCNMNEEGGEACYPYFPSKEEEAVKYGKMLVTLQSKASYTDFIVRKFSMQEDKVTMLCIYTMLWYSVLCMYTDLCYGTLCYVCTRIYVMVLCVCVCEREREREREHREREERRAGA